LSVSLGECWKPLTDAFLKKHAPNLDTHQLALDLGSFSVHTSHCS
jgi:hypothetical protein